MAILVFVVIGSMIGLLVNAMTPQHRAMGLVGSAAVGILGALLGGVAGTLLGGTATIQQSSAGVLGSVLGALLLCVLVQALRPRRQARS